MAKHSTIGAIFLLAGCVVMDQRPAGYPESCLLARVLASAEAGQSYICERPCDRKLEERLLKDFHDRGLVAKVAAENEGSASLTATTPAGLILTLNLRPVSPNGKEAVDKRGRLTHTRVSLDWPRPTDRDKGYAELNRIYGWKAEEPSVGTIKK